MKPLEEIIAIAKCIIGEPAALDIKTLVKDPGSIA